MGGARFVKFLLARRGRAIVGAALCAAVLFAAALCGGLMKSTDRRVKSADVFAGKWSGDIAWAAASGRDYNRILHTSLFFLPGGVAGTVITFPTGALGGKGTYTFKDGKLTVHCTDLNLNGHSVPMAPYARAPWFHDTATYTVSFDGTNLMLKPVSYTPTSAPCYPLLASTRPLVLSRAERPVETPNEPAMKE